MANVYLNGKYIELGKAKISVLDRGFTFGDGVYEVLPVYNHQIFCFKQHIQRLEHSLAAIHIVNPLTYDQWLEILTSLVLQDLAKDQSIYLQVTRGISERDHSIKTDTEPTVFVMCSPMKKKDHTQGVNAITYDDIRWKFCDIKAITLLSGILLRHMAETKDATEAILLRDDIVTEGAASNVFIVKDDIVRTPAKNGSILSGITRDLVVELLKECNMPCEETRITKDELQNADEIWITSSTWEIVPVIQLDGKAIGHGKPGEVWGKANELYQKYKQKVIANNQK